MANSDSRKRPAKAPARKKRNRTSRRQVIIVGVVILVLIGFVLPSILPVFTSKGPSVPPVAGRAETMPEPLFQKDGELAFISSETGLPIQKIEIEKADNDMKRQFGLMYRRSMADTQGMLFLFDQNQQQSFWMKNTLIPLDIMFVDENLTITTLHENTKPLSEGSLPSAGPAKYVVEVNGGFAKKYGVKVGDRVSW